MTLSVGHRIIGGFGIIIVLVFGLGWYQLLNIERMKDHAIRITDVDFEALDQLRNLEIARRQLTILRGEAWTAYFLNKAGVGRDDTLAAQKEWALTYDRLTGVINAFDAFAEKQAAADESEAQKKVWVDLRTANQTLLHSVAQTAKITADIFGLIQRDNVTQYPTYHELLFKQREEFEGSARRLGDLISDLAFTARNGIIETHNDIRSTSVIALVLVLFLGITVAVLIYRSVTSPLRDFMRFVEGVGSGDLTRKLENMPADELGRLGGHLNDMVASLNDIARQIRGATGNLNTATAEMQASVQQQSAGTSEQNAAIQQITSTLSEITRSGTQITERAKAVAQTAEAAASASKSGIQAVNETTRAMTTIREQAEKVASQIVALTEKTQSIGAIISTVNDLAERSNLLALNAAIEAAAAGEHGQSFAVVADEMKNLATQAKDATVEVRSILGDIQHGIGIAVMQTEEAVKRVESGKDQAVATEQTISNLARSIEQSVATFEQIVAATGQQQVGIEQVTQSIHSIREASEQMASGGKEVGRAASTLASLSNQLQKVVERYQV